MGQDFMDRQYKLDPFCRQDKKKSKSIIGVLNEKGDLQRQIAFRLIIPIHIFIISEKLSIEFATPRLLIPQF